MNETPKVFHDEPVDSVSDRGIPAAVERRLFRSCPGVYEQSRAGCLAATEGCDSVLEHFSWRAGGGYFTFRLAEAVGPAGKVYAVDTDPGALDFIVRRAREQGIANVDLVQATENDLRLPDGGVDLLFTCNTVHHLEHRATYFRAVARSLRPDGRIAILDFTPSGVAWLFGHGTAKEVIRREMETAGYRLTDEFDYLPKQHFQVFRLK